MADLEELTSESVFSRKSTHILRDLLKVYKNIFMTDLAGAEKHLHHLLLSDMIGDNNRKLIGKDLHGYVSK